jgi:phosphate transport system substrate-binding protein
VRRSVVPLACWLLLAPVLSAEEPLPEYKRVRELKGTIRIEGSPTVGLLIEAMTGPLARLYPDLRMERVASGTEAAMDALIAGRCDLAAMGHRAAEAVTAKFREKFGYAPTPVVVAFDAVAIYVHKDNPLEQITLQQLDSLYSAERRRGGPRVTRWGDLGLGGEWQELKILFFGFGPSEGVHAWMREQVLKGAPFRGIVDEQPGGGGLATACGSVPASIGYASQVFRTKRTKLLKIGADEAGPFYEPSRANCLDGKYPLARELLIYVNRPPGKELPPKVLEFLAFATSEVGQRCVEAAGSFRIDMKTARENLRAIGRVAE